MLCLQSKQSKYDVVIQFIYILLEEFSGVEDQSNFGLRWSGNGGAWLLGLGQTPQQWAVECVKGGRGQREPGCTKAPMSAARADIARRQMARLIDTFQQCPFRR
uniref:Uncharacterized protein n=1 Tax=Mesocestoides corti TaxID=53468 RepID=A0A5K3EK93_MESCO